MHLNDFNFTLPTELIARYPLEKRSASKLLCVEGANLTHKHFSDVVGLLAPGDLLIMNDTKVIPARIYAQKTTGGQAELLVERILDDQRMLAQVRVSKPPKIGDYLILTNGIRLQVIARKEQFYELSIEDQSKTLLSVIEDIGEIPLPPYMHRAPEESDKERYQTVYAKYKGSVAAPTAGFHFDEALLTELRERKIEFGYVTLHIGAGTFAPVRVENITEHQMHAEYFEVSAELCERIRETKARGNRVVAVGTTTLRSLEAASQCGEITPFSGETAIFIYPGYHFNCVDALITNLHLPCSTLLMLVCAFGGYEPIMHAYREAVEKHYRFYSYGDAMWMTRQE